VNAYGDMYEWHALAVSVDTADMIALGGLFSGTAQFGSTPLGPAGATDGFLAYLEPGGAATSAMSFPGTASESLAQSIVAVARIGDAVVVAGNFTGAVVLSPSVTVPNPAGNGAFVAKYTSGTLSWDVPLGGDDLHARSLAVDLAGDVVVVGDYTGSADLNGAPVGPTAGVGPDGFAIKVTGDLGHTVWTKTLGADAADSLTDVAVDGAGDFVVVGYHGAGVVLDGCDPISNYGSEDAFAAGLDSSGACVWLKGFGFGGPQLALATAVGSDGNVYMAGKFRGDIMFEQSYSSLAVGNDHIFLASLDPGTGMPLWSRVYMDTKPIDVMDLAAAPASVISGGIALVGNFAGILQWSSGPLVSTDGDGFVLRFDQAHNELWSRVIGGAGSQSASAVAIDSKGAVVVTGDFASPTDLGTGTMTPKGATDIYLMKLHP
jgi:hypothetical protein